MRCREAFATALTTAGFKIKKCDWAEGCYLEYSPEKHYFVDEGGEVAYPSWAHSWEPYVEPPKIIKWYRPRVVRHYPVQSPAHTGDGFFHTSPDIHHWYYVGSLPEVLEWDIIEAAEVKK